jgi:hypothetical protein
MPIILTLVLWFVWKEHPNVVMCGAFWLSVIWVIRSTRLIRYGGGFTILLGVVLNALVTEFNDGVMPVFGMPLHFQTAAPIWRAAQSGNHLLFLADQSSLQFFSIGDLALLMGTSMFLLGRLYPRLSKQ